MNRKQRRAAAKARGRSAFKDSRSAPTDTKLKAATSRHQAGSLAEARRLYAEILSREPDNVVALNHLGIITYQEGDACQATALFGKAIALRPGYAEAHSNLGNVLKDQGKLEDAVAAWRRALELKPDFADAHSNLGNALRDQAKLEDAVAACRRALELKPDFTAAYINLGNALKDQGKLEDAVAAYRRALELKPDYADAHNNLGVALRNQGKLEDAVAAYRRALELKPDFAAAHSNLGNALQDQGKLEDAMVTYRGGLELKPGYTLLHSNLLFHLHYIPGLTLEEIFAEHRRWNAQHAAPLASEIRPHINGRDPDRKVRVGFISGSFRRHPVGYMITRAVEARDGVAWELYSYSYTAAPDDLTERIRAAVDVWRIIQGLDDATVSRLIREDGIDILVDLTGHAERNRLLVFARKPAPVQVKWVGGQFNTTGMDAMDYFLTDAVATPPGAEKFFTEDVIRLPDGYACYEPPTYAPEVGPLPALNRGYATFGCFNKLAKVNAEVVATWARLLHRLPEARLLLKTSSFGDRDVRERYHAMFEAHGVERERVDLRGASPHAELLTCYNDIDIAVDPFPYSGCLTTYEALWMGVPVVTLAGETFAGRHSATHLHNVGLDDWVVETPEDYLAVAEGWSRDVAALADLRAGLRARMAASPLCDGARFARNLEAAFRTMWRRWCEDPATPPLSRDR